MVGAGDREGGLSHLRRGSLEPGRAQDQRLAHLDPAFGEGRDKALGCRPLVDPGIEVGDQGLGDERPAAVFAEAGEQLGVELEQRLGLVGHPVVVGEVQVDPQRPGARRLGDLQAAEDGDRVVAAFGDDRRAEPGEDLPRAGIARPQQLESAEVGGVLRREAIEPGGFDLQARADPPDLARLGRRQHPLGGLHHRQLAVPPEAVEVAAAVEVGDPRLEPRAGGDGDQVVLARSLRVEVDEVAGRADHLLGQLGMVGPVAPLEHGEDQEPGLQRRQQLQSGVEHQHVAEVAGPVVAADQEGDRRGLRDRRCRLRRGEEGGTAAGWEERLTRRRAGGRGAGIGPAAEGLGEPEVDPSLRDQRGDGGLEIGAPVGADRVEQVFPERQRDDMGDLVFRQHLGSTSNSAGKEVTRSRAPIASSPISVVTHLRQ